MHKPKAQIRFCLGVKGLLAILCRLVVLWVLFSKLGHVPMSVLLELDEVSLIIYACRQVFQVIEHRGVIG